MTEITGLVNKRELLRDMWRMVRSARLLRKSRLASEGAGLHDIRRDREYRLLKKEQHALTIRIKHLEKEIGRGSNERGE